MEKTLRIVTVVILAVTIILSCTVVGTRLTDPAAYSHTIEVLDQNRKTVLGLSAASAAASAAISALPDDTCTALAEEISELTSWFLMILGFIFLEKYLLTIFGAAACYLLIPLGCGALLIHYFFPNVTVRNVGRKLVALAIVLLLAIPGGIWVSDRVNDIYAESIAITVQSAEAVTDNLIGESSGETEEVSSVIDEAKNLLGNLGGSVAGVITQFKNILNRFIEATAVMIVTTCLIPILVVLFFGWVVRTLFNVPVVIPPYPFHNRKKEIQKVEEKELALTE